MIVNTFLYFLPQVIVVISVTTPKFIVATQNVPDELPPFIGEDSNGYVVAALCD